MGIRDNINSDNVIVHKLEWVETACKCHDCDSGEMISSGETRQFGGTLYEHACSNCFAKEWFRVEFPYREARRI